MKKTSLYFSILLLVSFLSATYVLGASQSEVRFGVPVAGMSPSDYRSLIFLDPQNTNRMDWAAVKTTPGYFLIDNQGEATVSVVDYDKGETIKKISMGESGNHHLWIIPGGRYAWSSQRYENDQFWTIDLKTLEVVDKFKVSMGGKKIIAPLHVGFAYSSPLAVVGNILDKDHGYLTLLSTVTRRPVEIIDLSCHGARDALFNHSDTLIFSTCQQAPKGVAVVDVKTRKEIKMIPIEGSRTGAMSPDGKYFMVGAKKAIHVFDAETAELLKSIVVPGGGGNITCLSDSSKCYGGLRKANSVAVIDMKKLVLIKVIETGKDANRLYLNPANPRYGLFANEAGSSEEVTIIDTLKDVAVKNIITGLGPHNVAFNPAGTRALVTTKKETEATLLDTSSKNPLDWDVITTEIDAGIQNNGVRWVPRPEVL